MKKINSFIPSSLIFLLSLSLSFLFNCSSGKVSSNNSEYSAKTSISITISVDNIVHLEGEQVWLSVQFKNEGSKPDSMHGMNEAGVYESLIIKDQNDRVLEYKGLIGDNFKIYYDKLMPGEVKNVEAELRDVFGDTALDQSFITFSPRNYFTVGTYKAELKKRFNPSNIIVSSNSLEFSVLKPEGGDESEFKMLRDIYNLTERGEKEQKAKIDAYKDFLKNYKTSKYFDAVFDTYIRMKAFTKIDFDENSIMEIQNYVENNPNKYQTLSLSWYLAKALKQFGGGINLAKKQLEILAAKFPNTRLEEGIRHALKSNLFSGSDN